MGGSAGPQRIPGRRAPKIVDKFIEDAANALAQNLTLLERNELEVNLSFHGETQLVLGLLPVTALFLQIGADSSDGVIPEWIELISTAFPSETAFITEVGKGVDPGTHAL